MVKTGDVIAKVAQPVAKILDRTIGPSGIGIYRTPIENCAGCHQMQANLNAGMSIAQALVERFWLKETKMEFIVNEMITQPYLVEAESGMEAIQKRKNGEGTMLPNRSEGWTAGVAPKPPQPQAAKEAMKPVP